MNVDWPNVDLDPVAQLRAVHASIPGSALEERVLAVPLDVFWAEVDDLEVFVPRIDPMVRRLKVLARDGEQVLAKSGLLLLDGDVRPGFMWMQSHRWSGRLFVVGTAARAVGGDRTHVAHMEGMTIPGARLLRPWFRRTVKWDLDGMERLAASR